MNSYGFIVVAPTYEGNLFPPMSYVLDLLSIKKLGSGKTACAIVTKLWGGLHRGKFRKSYPSVVFATG